MPAPMIATCMICPRTGSGRAALVDDLEAVGERIPVIDEDGVEPGHPRPTLNGWDDRIAVAHLRTPFDAACEGRADDALVNEGIALLQCAAGGEMSHAGGSARAAGRTVDGLVTVEHRVARRA